MKKIGGFIFVLLLLLSVFLVIRSSSGDLIGDGITVYRTALGGEPTAQAFLFVPFAGAYDGDDIYANVALDVNGDGAISAYDTPKGKQEEWVVKNVFADVLEGGGDRYVFAIVDPNFGEKSIAGTALLTKKPVVGEGWSADWREGAEGVKTFTIATVELEARDLYNTPDPTGKLATGFGRLGVPVAHAQGATPPAPAPTPEGAPGDYYARHDDVPDQNQLWNECAPTAVSNSFRWLAKKYNVEDRMPKGGVNDLIDELKGDLVWNDGVAHPNIIKGKNDFIKRHHLPFEAHQIGSEDDIDIVKKIADEMFKGQAVEVWLAFFNASGSPAGAHLVTVVGAGRKNGKDIIRFSDPDTLGRPSRDAYDVEIGNMLPNYLPNGGQAFIRYAYAQSPLQALTDGTWTDPRGGTAVAVGGGGVPLTPAEDDVTLSRSQFGFFSTSVGHPGDHVVGETFPVRATIWKTGKTREVDFWREGRRWTWTNGADAPWTIKGKFEGGGAVTPAVADNVPPTTSLSIDRYSATQNFTCVSPGFATVAYTADLGWTPSDEVPAEVKRYTHGTEFESSSDTMRVESPPFRCVAKPEVKKEEPKVAMPATCPGVVEDPTSEPVMVLTQGVECYPALQFHQAGPDKCTETHWHANAGSARSLTGKTWVDPSGCGFGMIREVYTAQVRLSPDQLAPYIQ